MTNGQELGKDMIVETGEVKEDGTIQKVVGEQTVEEAKARVDTYPCKIVFTTRHEKEFKNQEELIAWAQDALPNNRYVTTLEDSDDYEEVSQYLRTDYEAHGFKPPAVPINTPSKLLALISYDCKYESMGPGDYNDLEAGDDTIEVLYK